MGLTSYADDAFDAEQARKDKLRKQMESTLAEKKIKAYGRRYNWNEDDVTLVLQVLGLAESPPPLRAVTRR